MDTPTNPTAAADPQPSQIQTLPLEVQFAKTGFGPGTPFYVTPSDSIGFRVWSSIPNVTLGFVARVQRPNGEIAYPKGNIVAPGNRTQQFLNVPLTEGFLVSALMGVLNSVPKRGQCYGLVEVYRGGVAADATVTLCSGYIDSTGRPATWPGGISEASISGRGVLRSITGTTPAAGADINEVVPSNAHWLLKSLTANLTTSATVATRISDFVIDDGVNQFFVTGPGISQAAGVTIGYSASSAGSLTTADTAETQWLLGTEVPLLAGYRIRTVTRQIQVGDQWTAPQYQVEEWIED